MRKADLPKRVHGGYDTASDYGYIRNKPGKQLSEGNLENFPDEFADSVLKYGMNTTAYTETCKDELFVKEHEITLTRLSPDTMYYFVVNSTDQSDNSAESSEYRFKYGW